MRVLHVMASGALGGGLRHLLALLPALRDLGIECCAAIGDDGPGMELLRAAGITVTPISLMQSRFDVRAGFLLAHLVGAAEADIVHFHGTRAALYGALGRTRPGFPLAFYSVHGLSYRKPLAAPKRALFIAAEAIACRTAKRVISVSATDLRDLVARRLLAPGRGCHIPNSLDVEHFAPGDRAAARARVGLPLDGTLVVTVARLVPQKSVADLIEAFGQVQEATLVVVGDGPERDALQRRAERLAPRTFFLGSRQDVPDLLRAADLFALSSRWEGEPISLIEAMASGLPCVATATDGARELLGNGAGVLVPIGEPRALGQALQQLAADSERCRRLGEAARLAVTARTPQAMAARTALLYRDAISAAR